MPHWFYFLIPILLGLSTVVQTGLNRRIGAEHSLEAAALLNGIVLSVAAAIATTIWAPGKFQGLLAQWKWWYIVPGLLGFGLVFGLPLAVAKIGALRSFVLFVAIQLATSAVWDAVVEEKVPTVGRLAGALLALVGATMAVLL